VSAFMEIFNNIAIHAYNRKGGGAIEISLTPSDRELVIEGVSTTCGCTAAIAGEKTLAPGRSTPLTVTLQTRDYRGKVERKVLVRSNDAKTPLTEITVSTTVEAPARP